jgi:hypothetical protein
METQQKVIARHVTFDETEFPGCTLHNEDDEYGSDTLTEKSSDITVSDTDADEMSNSDESQAQPSAHFETPDEMAQSSGNDSPHDEDTHSDSSESNNEGNGNVRRYPARTRRAPLSLWASSTSVIATSCQGAVATRTPREKGVRR